MRNLITALLLATALITLYWPAVADETNVGTIVFDIETARIDSDTHFMIAALKVTASDEQVVALNTYDPEYDLRINGGEYKALGKTRWRHPFGPEDIKILSGTNSWTRGYFYKLTNLPPTSIQTIQFRIKRGGSQDSDVSNWLSHTNFWHGVAETREYRLK